MSLPPPPAGIVPLPDAVAVVCGHLRAQLPDTVAVGTRLPDEYDGSQQVVRVDRIGGAMDRSAWAWLDNPHLDVEAWAPLQTDASDLIALVRAALVIAPYTDLTALGAVVCNVEENVGPQWFPDPDYPPAGHQLVQVVLTLHPVPPTP